MKTVQVLRRLVPEAWGGIETVVTATVRALSQNGVRSRVLCTSALSRPGRETVEGVEVERFRYAYLRMPPRRGLRDALDRKAGNPVSPGLTAALMTDPDVDLYVAHSMGRLGGLVRATARLRRRPYVVFIHGGHLDVSDDEEAAFRDTFRGTIDPVRPLDYLLGTDHVLRDAAAIVALGEGEHAALQAAYPHVPVHLLPNGVDCAKFDAAVPGETAVLRRQLGIPEGAPLLLTVARLDPQKGQGVLIEAAARMEVDGEPPHILLIGHPTRPDYAAGLRAAAAAAGLGDRLHVIEGLAFDDPRLIGAYHAADVFVLPSIHEPFGIVILEAWAAGRPVVASRVGGIPTFTTDGENILHAAPGDAADLAATLERALGDGDLRRRIAAAGHALARERYDWQAVSERLRRIYEDAV